MSLPWQQQGGGGRHEHALAVAAGGVEAEQTAVLVEVEVRQAVGRQAVGCRGRGEVTYRLLAAWV